MKNSAIRNHTSCLAILCLTLLLGHSSPAALSPARLSCEYLSDPIGIDTTAPRLSWIDESKERSQTQSAYQVLVATSESKLARGEADLWDSGKVASGNSLHIPYAGKTLASAQRCFWKVRVWDQDGAASRFSRPSSWEMGLLNDWAAKWIGQTTEIESRPAPLFRRTFNLDGKIKQARVYICGLGYYELHINGKRIGDHLLDPGYTRYDRRDLYVTYDVTDALRRGENAVGVILGTGWYDVHSRAVWNFHKAPWRAAPALLLELKVDYADGRSQTVVTDRSWKTSAGPIVFDSIYGGETYDARREKPGWDTISYVDSDWASAPEVEGPKGKLTAQMMSPIKADREIKPVRITEPRPGTFVFDFGQNLAGFAQLTVRGPAGTKVTMKYGERLNRDGTIDRADIQQHIVRVDTNQQYQTDTYILKGAGRETWHSRFTYHGFQYVEVTGFPGKPSTDSLEAVFIHSAVAPRGEFQCSNPLFNRIWRAGQWSYLSNLQSIPTDCPHREKNGWTGDAHLAAEQALFNYAPEAFYTKWINDLADEQKPSGELPGIVPTSGWGYEWGNGPAWDSAFLLIPYYLYEYSGDSRILTEHYQGLKRYVDYLTTKANNGIVGIGLNDWAPFKTQTPADITSTAYYYRDATIVALAARLSGNDAEAKHYEQLAGFIKSAFNTKFYNPESGLYGNGSQTSLSCALYQGLVEEANRERVLSNLVAAVDRQNGHIDTGILGAKYILNALTENGRADVACRIAGQRDLPSWGWWLEQGATTLWEQWNGTESRNHIMFGDICAWFYKALAGINPDPAAPGFQHVIIRPHRVGALSAARGFCESVRGPIASDWKISNNLFTLTINIPANSSATVYIPSPATDQIKEGNSSAAKAPGVQFISADKESSVYRVGSGEYKFSVPL